MKQYLQIDYSNQLKSEATPADDVEGTLYKFIPADYTKSEEAFEQTVEEDATAFKPLGTRLGAYAPAKGKGKGKAKAKGANVTEEVTDGDEVAFEFYHVSTQKSLRADGSRHGLRRGSASIIGGCSCSSCCSSKVAVISRKTRTLGSLSLCKYSFIARLTTDMRDASGRLASLHTTLSVTRLATRSGTTPTRSGCA